jgi:hypothetical protein
MGQAAMGATQGISNAMQNYYGNQFMSQQMEMNRQALQNRPSQYGSPGPAVNMSPTNIIY